MVNDVMPRPASATQRGFGASVRRRSVASAATGPGHSSPRLQLSARGRHQALYQQHVAPLLASGRLEDAEPILNLLRQSHTGVAEVYRDLAALADARGDLSLAERHREQWLEHPSTLLVELEAQAAWAEQLGRNDQAYRLRCVLLQRNPSHQEARLAIARHLLLREAFDEACQLLREARLDDDHLAMALYAVSLVEQSQAAEAARWARLSLRCAESALAHAVLASALHQLFDELTALDHLHRAQELSSNSAETPWPIARLLAGICLEQRRMACAEQLLQVATRQQPWSRRLRYQFGELLLLQGQLTRGFQQWAFEHQDHPTDDRGLESTPLVLLADGTLGDTLLLSRYAPWIARARQSTVHFYVQPPAVELLRHSLPASVVVKPLNGSDQQASCTSLALLSAPAVMGACDLHPELQQPCLEADPALVAVWRERLGLAPGERLIGINWHGSALHALQERVASNVPLEVFAPLAALPGVRLVALQKGFGLEQLRSCSFRHSFVTCQDLVTRESRLEQMAAVIALCDWVVCDDSGPAHLAGSLGRPTCVLLSTRSGWRWGCQALSSPWYPSMRLLRCRDRLGWSSLAEQAARIAREA